MREASRKTAITLFFVRFLRLLVSVVTLSVSAKYFGVGTDREIWILSLNFVTVLNLALWGPLNETFRAKFIFLKSNEGEEVALQRTSALLLFTLLVLGLLIIVIEFFSVPIGRLIAPAYSAASLERLSLMLKFLLGTTILTQATQLLSSILNTYNSFYIPEITGFFSAILNLVFIITLSPLIGIYSFVVSTYISLFLLLMTLVYQVRKRNIRLFKGKINVSWSNVKPFIYFSIPFFIPYVVGQGNGLIEKSISNLIGNSTVAIIDYSKKITDIIQTVLTSVLATIMVPILSSHFSGKKIELVKTESKKYLQLVLLILGLVIPVLAVSSGAICNILYNKGNIASRDLDQIAKLITFYGISLTSVFMYLIFGLVLLSVNKSKQYAMCGVIAQVLMIVLNLVLYKKMGIYTFVCTVTLSHAVAAGLMFFQLPFSRMEIGVSVLKYFGLIIITTIAVLGFNTFLYRPENDYLNILLNGSLVVAIIALISFVLKLGEVQVLKQILLNRKKKD